MLDTFDTDRIVRAPEALKITGYRSRITLWRKARDRSDPFPAPVHMGGGRTGWRLSELNEWIANLSTTAEAR